MATHKNMATVQHIKGSDITGSWARDLDIKPDCAYNISVTIDQTLTPSLQKFKQALNSVGGLWKDRPEIMEEMAQIRQEANRY